MAELAEPQQSQITGPRPWPKGVSGNPGGRPKNSVLRLLLSPHRRSMVARLLKIAKTGKDKDAIRAIALMLAYTDGNPKPVSMEDLSDAEILSIVSKRAEQLRAEQKPEAA